MRLLSIVYGIIINFSVYKLVSQRFLKIKILSLKYVFVSSVAIYGLRCVVFSHLS